MATSEMLGPMGAGLPKLFTTRNTSSTYTDQHTDLTVLPSISHAPTDVSLDSRSSLRTSHSSRKSTIQAATRCAKSTGSLNVQFVLHGVQAASSHAGSGDHQPKTKAEEKAVGYRHGRLARGICLAGSKMPVLSVADVALEPTRLEPQRDVLPAVVLRHRSEVHTSESCHPESKPSNSIFPYLPPTFRPRGVLNTTQSQIGYVFRSENGNPPVQHKRKYKSHDVINLEKFETYTDAATDRTLVSLSSKHLKSSSKDIVCQGGRVSPTSRFSLPQLSQAQKLEISSREQMSYQTTSRFRPPPPPAPSPVQARSPTPLPSRHISNITVNTNCSKPSLVDRCLNNLSSESTKTSVSMPSVLQPPKLPDMHSLSLRSRSRPEVQVQSLACIPRSASRLQSTSGSTEAHERYDKMKQKPCCHYSAMSNMARKSHSNSNVHEKTVETPRNVSESGIENQLDCGDLDDLDTHEEEDGPMVGRISPPGRIMKNFTVAESDSIRRFAMDRLFQQHRSEEITAILAETRRSRSLSKSKMCGNSP